MAYLHNVQTGERIYLHPHHTFGRRAESVDTHIRAPEISKIHAAIKWNGQSWSIRNLGRNGTWLDGKKIASTSPLSLDQHIVFANLPQMMWRVDNLDEPKNLLIGLTSASRMIELKHHHLLPDNKHPVAALYFCASREQWVLDSDVASGDQREQLLQADDTVAIDGHLWRLFLVGNETQTIELSTAEGQSPECEFLFELSLDEEHAKLKLRYQDELVDLGERSHHYLLLHLARLKATHASQGLDKNSQGWIENEFLAKQLGIDVAHINIQVFRARKQLADAFESLQGLSALIERRRGAVRLNCDHAQIIKGSDCERIGDTRNPI